MLDKKRIQEARQNIPVYLRDGLLHKQPFKKEVFAVLTKNAQESIQIADHLASTNKSDLWVIVTSYYAMFYSANAVLCKLGYKVGEKIPHKVTADALIVYAKDKLKDSLLQEYEEIQDQALAGIKADTLMETFDAERKKRSRIQYQTQETEKHAKAKTSLARAKEFLLEMDKLLSE